MVTIKIKQKAFNRQFQRIHKKVDTSKLFLQALQDILKGPLSGLK